jgi:DNA-binding response OmpR family regulator
MFTRWTSLAAASEQAAFEAIVLDCNGADSADADALKHIRGLVGPAVPILVCSKRCGEMDIVDALRAGADDYLVKPLRGAELIARLEAVTRRRTRASIRLDVREVGEFRIDCRQRTIHRNQVAIPLTSIDFELSVLFLGNVQRLLTRDHIHEVIWKSAHAVGSRTLDTHVSRVRNKLSLLPSHGWRLVSVYGYGYRLLRLEGPLAATPQMAAERASTGPAVAQHVAAA